MPSLHFAVGGPFSPELVVDRGVVVAGAAGAALGEDGVASEEAEEPLAAAAPAAAPEPPVDEVDSLCVLPSAFDAEALLSTPP